MVKQAVNSTAKLSTFVLFILVGSTVFGLTFRAVNGDLWVEHLLTSEAAGAVNLTAPQPVRNAEFAATLAKVLKRPAWLPVPSFGPKLLLGSQLADALLFDGQRVLPRVLEGDGFAFRHADLDTGLRAALGR